MGRKKVNLEQHPSSSLITGIHLFHIITKHQKKISHNNNDNLPIFGPGVAKMKKHRWTTNIWLDLDIRFVAKSTLSVRTYFPLKDQVSTHVKLDIVYSMTWDEPNDNVEDVCTNMMHLERFMNPPLWRLFQIKNKTKAVINPLTNSTIDRKIEQSVETRIKKRPTTPSLRHHHLHCISYRLELGSNPLERLHSTSTSCQGIVDHRSTSTSTQSSNTFSSSSYFFRRNRSKVGSQSAHLVHHYHYLAE